MNNSLSQLEQNFQRNTSIFESLYSYNHAKQKQRYLDLLPIFSEHFVPEGSANLHCFSTPGRTEILGNHTDHNLGRVIAASVELDLIGIIRPRSDSWVKLYSAEFGHIEVDLKNLNMQNHEKGTSHSLIRGIASRICELNGSIGGFEGVTHSQVLSGSGLSSSATFEIFISTIFNHLYNNNIFSIVEMGLMSQYAENHYLGKPCGLMDQLACAHGGIISIDFEKPEEPQIRSLDMPSFLDGYELFVLDTGGDHANLTDAYSDIPNEMKKVANFFEQKYLRSVDEESFLKEIRSIRAELKNDRALLRALHYLRENKRVDLLNNAIDNNQEDLFFSTLKASAASSFQYLQNVTIPNDHKNQGVALSLAMVDTFLNGQGACRVHGGGFAGTIQVYVPRSLKNDFYFFMSSLLSPSQIIPLPLRSQPTTSLAFS